MIQSVKDTLQELVKERNQGSDEANIIIRDFFSKIRPKISISEYLDRILSYLHFDEKILIYSIYLLKKLKIKYSELIFNEMNIYRFILIRLFFCSLIISIKFLSYEFSSKKMYSFVGGIPISELNSLEETFLSLLNFEIFVDDREFERFYRTMQINLTP